MSEFPFRQKLKYTVLLTLFFLAGYKVTQIFSSHQVSSINLELPWEASVPFVPETLFIYVMVYLLFPTAFLLMPRKQDFEKLAVVFIITSLIHFVFFLLMPVQLNLRPNFADAGGFLSALFRLFHKMDATNNCFPSMHVSFVFLSYYAMKKFRPEHAPFFLFMAIAISVSTMLVKQHFFLDIISAYFLVLAVKPLLEEVHYNVFLEKWRSAIRRVKASIEGVF